MAYQLGIDLGTTFTAAATCRDGRAEVSSLGNRGAAVPSVVYLRPDETLLMGEPAERRALTEPGRVVREFKRRVGDPTPIILGGAPYSAEALQAKMLRSIIDAVAEREGGAPEHVSVTHPANWGPYKQELFIQTIRLADLENATTLTEPEAAAVYYASTERVEPGAIVAVYDLGGGTFDAAVLRKTDEGFEILGRPEGIERLGGIDFDEAVFDHVDRALGGAVRRQDPNDGAALAAVARLRQDCVAAKEALSSDTDVVIPVLLPDLQSEVRLTRAEFEGMIRPTITETVSALRRALRSAEVEPADVAKILLVGGSSRIPLVSEMVSRELGRPVAVDAHPKYAIALGATLVAARAAGHGGNGQAASTAALPLVDAEAGARDDPAGVETVALPVEEAPAEDATTVTDAVEGAAVAAATAPVEPAADELADDESAPDEPPPEPPSFAGRPFESPEPSRRPLVLAAAAAVAVLAVAGVAILVLRDGEPEPVAAPTPAVETPQEPEEPEEDEEEIDLASEEELIEEPEEPEDPEPALPTPPPGMEHFSRISAIDVEDGAYVIEFDVFGFEPTLGGQNKHVHFFFDTVAPEDAGVPGSGPWRLYPNVPDVVGTSPFTELAVSDTPQDAEELCILVANSDHSVVPDTGSCMPLP